MYYYEMIDAFETTKRILTKEENLESLSVLFYERLYCFRDYNFDNNHSNIDRVTFLKTLLKKIIRNSHLIMSIINNNPTCKRNNEMHQFIKNIYPIIQIKEMYDSIVNTIDDNKYQKLYFLMYASSCCVDELKENNLELDFNKKFGTVFDIDLDSDCEEYDDDFNNFRTYLTTNFAYN
jgi:hypothetical protein